MGSLVVEFSLEVVEGSLLGSQVSSDGSADGPLESTVHALVRPVFGGRGGSDSLVLDTESQPPDVEVGQSVDCLGAEGRSVVGAYGSGKPVFTEGSLEDGSGTLGGDARAPILP